MVCGTIRPESDSLGYQSLTHLSRLYQPSRPAGSSRLAAAPKGAEDVSGAQLLADVGAAPLFRASDGKQVGPGEEAILLFIVFVGHA